MSLKYSTRESEPLAVILAIFGLIAVIIILCYFALVAFD